MLLHLSYLCPENVQQSCCRRVGVPDFEVESRCPILVVSLSLFVVIAKDLREDERVSVDAEGVGSESLAAKGWAGGAGGVGQRWGWMPKVGGQNLPPIVRSLGPHACGDTLE